MKYFKDPDTNGTLTANDGELKKISVMGAQPLLVYNKSYCYDSWDVG